MGKVNVPILHNRTLYTTKIGTVKYHTRRNGYPVVWMSAVRGAEARLNPAGMTTFSVFVVYYINLH